MKISTYFLCCLTLIFSAGCNRARVPLDSAESAAILLFNGTGTSPEDVKAFEGLLAAATLPYSTADSVELNTMSEARLRAFRLLIIPGGNFEEIGGSLDSATAAKVREAVRDGLNYHGICAGAFLAGRVADFGFNLTDQRFAFAAPSRRGARISVEPVTSADGRTLDQYWEDGPELSGWGDVVAKYGDGTPAVVQGYVGKGWAVLSGVHAEAPEGWRAMLEFDTPVEVDNAYAVELIRAALDGRPLAHF